MWFGVVFGTKNKEGKGSFCCHILHEVDRDKRPGCSPYALQNLDVQIKFRIILYR